MSSRKEAAAAYQKEYRIKNIEKIKAKSLVYYEYHKEENRKRAAKWQKENSERYRRWLYEHSLIKNYNITIEDYKKMLNDQNGVCAICFREDKKGRKLCVDHNHDTGKVRGLLCGNCNKLLGMAGDDKKILSRSIKYLEEK